MRLSTNFFLSIVLFLCIQYTSAQDGRVLNAPYVHQIHLNEWCWTAATNMVIRYYGNDVELYEVVEYARSQNPGRFGTQNCCNTPTPTDCINTNFISGSGGITGILTNWGITNDLLSRPYTMTEIETVIDDGRPFIIDWFPPGAGGHTVVGRGYESSNVYIINPLDGYHVFTYGWVVEQATGTQVWDYTHRLLNTPPCADVTFLYTNPINSDVTSESTNGIEISSIIGNNSDVIFRSGNDIILQPGFEIQQGSSLELETDPSLGCH